MTHYDVGVVFYHLQHNAMFGIVMLLDWLLGMAVALRAGEFKVEYITLTLRKWAIDLFGLSIIAAATGVQLKIGDFDAAVLINAGWWALAAGYGAKLIDGFIKKFSAFASPAAAQKYEDTREDARAKGVT